jgi:glucuronoarabinoxylan endo-1,4-beta-xylanase
MQTGTPRNMWLCFVPALILPIAYCCKSQTPVNTSSDKTAYIDLSGTQQVIRGFGGVNMPGWPAVGDMTPEQVQTAFGSGNGQLGFTILRVRISFDSSEFSLEVPTAKLVASLGSIIIASPWTPPAWMKSNKNIVGGTLDTNYYSAYANHLKSFADTMSNNGVTLHAISIQNEPEVSVSYESCHWNASQMLNFIKNNSPAIGADIIVDENGAFNHTITDAILNDPAAAANISIIGGHIYGSEPAPYPLAAAKGKELWMTEHLVLDTSWTASLGTGKEINDCMNAGMNAYIWWYIRRYYGPMRDDGTISKRGYVMSQYARFVRPGYTNVSATAAPQSYIDVTAYTNGSKVVIVALNRNSSPRGQTFVIQNGSVSIFTPYVTSSTQNCVQGSDITVSGNSFSVDLAASSITTFVSN